jgi:hypothetical protein
VSVIDDIPDAMGGGAQSLGTDVAGLLPGDLSTIVAEALTSM